MVETRDAEGNPICFVCHEPVMRVGESCTRTCYAHFLVAVVNQAGPIEMENLVDLCEQPWYVETA